MTTEKLLGIDVCTDRDTVANWSEIRPFIRKGLERLKKDQAQYIKSLQRRFGVESKGIENIVDRTVKKKPVREKHLKLATIKLVDPGTGCNLKKGNFKSKSAILAGLTVRKKQFNANKDHYSVLKQALSCHTAGCVAYQTEISSLLGNLGTTILFPRPSTASELNAFGQDKLQQRLKFQTMLPKDNTAKDVNIEVLFASSPAKGGCPLHVEILSGILFEAGNVYIGNFGPSCGGDKSEPPVALHNVRQVSRIVRAGHPITKTDWRNLMSMLFATDVNPSDFKLTADYKKVYFDVAHDVSAQNI